MNTADYNVLRKYKKGHVIENDLERGCLERYASIGMVNPLGYTTKDDNPRPTASLTGLGKRMVGRKRIRRNPLLNAIYLFFGPIT